MIDQRPEHSSKTDMPIVWPALAGLFVVVTLIALISVWIGRVGEVMP